MKKLLLLSLIYFIIFFNLYAKPTSIDSLKKRVQTLEITSKRYLKINDSLNINNSKLITENNGLNKEIDYNEKLLDKYDTLNNRIFALVGMLFAAFGLIGYFLIFKPAREDLKEAQIFLKEIKNDMDKVFSDYTIKYRDKLIDNALNQLENKNVDDSSKNHYVNYLRVS